MRMILRRMILAMAALATSLLAADQKPADQKPLPWEKNRLQIGLSLYRANCIVCHDIDRPQSESKKLGPSFYQLFRQPKMPLGGVPPTRDYIKTMIKSGFPPLMPEFDDKLSTKEIDTLLDFLQSK